MDNNKFWYQKAIIYEFYVDKFAGNFQNLITKLDYLSNLGVNTLWLLPHYSSPLGDGGYDVSDYYSVHSDLGNITDFQKFLNTAHKLGFKVVTDLVLNHTSIENKWFVNHPDWYIWNDNPHRFPDAFVHFSELKPTKNWIFYAPKKAFYYATFYPFQPDLNWDNPEVEMELFKVADFWLDLGVDGFRLDAISRLAKRDGTNCFALPETHQILKRFRNHIDSKYSDKVLIAEAGGWANEAYPFFGECQLVLHFPLAMRLLSSIPYQEVYKYSDALSQTQSPPSGCSWAGFLTNHDSVDIFFLRDWGEKNWFLDTIDPGRKFTNYEQTSMGARLSEICAGDASKIIWATQQLLSLPNVVPIIYYGNEIGMRNLNLDSKPKDIREFVRGNFDWTEAEKQLQDPNSLLNKISMQIKSRQQ